MKKFIVTSNIFLFAPVVAAMSVHEWLYASIGLTACIFSPIYHYLRENHSSRTILLSTVRDLDWLSAVAAYSYMYYFIFSKINSYLQFPFAIALLLTLIFFWYGFKFGNYQKSHPWFHVFLPVLSTIIVLSK